MLSLQFFLLPFAFLQLILLCATSLALAQDLPLNSFSSEPGQQMVGNSFSGSISGTVNFSEESCFLSEKLNVPEMLREKEFPTI